MNMMQSESIDPIENVKFSCVMTRGGSELSHNNRGMSEWLVMLIVKSLILISV